MGFTLAKGLLLHAFKRDQGGARAISTVPAPPLSTVPAPPPLSDRRLPPCTALSLSASLCVLLQVLNAPLAFSLTTERGRILTRFSKDLDALDAALPAMLAQV